MTSYILSGAELEQYFEMDADQLARVRSGEIQNIEIIIDDEKKTASYIEVSNEELHSNTRNENYIDDNYEGVKKFFAEKEAKKIEGGIKMTRKWQDVLEHAKYFAEMDYLEGIKPESWKEKNAMRDLEDHLRMSEIWNKYEGTDEEYDALEFFVEEYNKELEKLWNESAE